jgi:hypothetical protein
MKLCVFLLLFIHNISSIESSSGSSSAIYALITSSSFYSSRASRCRLCPNLNFSRYFFEIISFALSFTMHACVFMNY